MDKLLGSNINFLLGNWVEGAVAWAKDPSEIPGLRFNALNQITLWGPDGQSTCVLCSTRFAHLQTVNDYAAKHWSELVGDYYFGRWSLLLDRLLGTC